jgi:hypothetical protein
MIGLAGPYGFNPMKYRSTRPIFADVEVIEKAMPVTFACSVKTPLLLFHGADDSIVIPENSRELKRRVDAMCWECQRMSSLTILGIFLLCSGYPILFLQRMQFNHPLKYSCNHSLSSQVMARKKVNRQLSAFKSQCLQRVVSGGFGHPLKALPTVK